MKINNKRYIFFLFIPLWILTSCQSDEPVREEIRNEKTLFMYLPWSSNLTSYFYQNINDMEACIESMGGLHNERVIVFISKTSTEASLFEIKYENGKCRRVDIKPYSAPAFTTEVGITRILEDVISYAPAKRYSMIIGCHGMGWLPVKASRAIRYKEKLHWDYTDRPLTRYFGGTTAEFQTDISTLSAAIENAGVKMEYILFDDCYMSSIEVAYELKDAADYLIASTCEVMAYGMPYATMGKHLLGTPDYKAVCDDFYEFYSNYSVPCGTLSVTDLSKIDGMAGFMRQLNSIYSFNEYQLGQLQNLDGYSPTIFYDFGDYIRLMLEQNVAPESMRNEFEVKLSGLVPYKTSTAQFFTATRGPLKLNRYSGITTSDPSVSQRAVDKYNTKWYYATH
ncbi:MAG: Clostripain family protein [Muribaculaceae bacterium]|nr:Clostripain family protein [Muribaculaceae bacterium]